jgi:hypothetical protein
MDEFGIRRVFRMPYEEVPQLVKPRRERFLKLMIDYSRFRERSGKKIRVCAPRPF